MGFGPFDSAGLSVVGYAHVKTDGTSPDCNSGIATARSSAGTYTITLPTNAAEDPSRVFVAITPINSSPIYWWVQTVSATLRVIVFENPGLQATDTEFEIIVYRTIVSPPAGAPA
jgi:hypothetical protein